jgi:superfamily II DNA or RNA helicase
VTVAHEGRAPDVVLEVDNLRVRVRQAPQDALWALHNGLAYLSPSAADAGFEEAIPTAPDGEEGQYVWDGMIRFLRRPEVRRDGSRAAPWFETGLLQRALSVLQTRWFVHVLDSRRRPDPNHDVPFWFVDASKPPLFDYQEAAVRAAVEAGRGVIVAPPRAGKTRILGELVRVLNQPVLWVAPTTSIVDQTARVLLDLGLPKHELRILGGEWLAKDALPRVWLGTAAAVASIPKEIATSREVIVIDELHHTTKQGSWGRELHRLFPHVFHWYGASGTYFRSSGDDMALEAFLSGVVYSISGEELIARGRLVKTKLAFLPVVTERLKRGRDPRVDGIVRHDHRNALIASCALHLASLGRRVLIMCAIKEQGNRIAEIVNHHGPRTKRGGHDFAEFLYRGRGGTQSAADMAFRRKMIAAFLDGSGPAVLIGTSLLGEGVDLPDCDAIIWASAQSAAVSYLQGMYRVSTAAPGKSTALAIDFADRHHPKLLEGSMKRLEIAYRDPVFDVSLLPGPEHLASWVAGAAR